MRVVHCGAVCASRSREIKSTADEALNSGIQSVIAYEYWCQNPDCRRKLYGRSDRVDYGYTPIRRVRRKDRAAFIARIQPAKEGNAVLAQRLWEGKATTGMIWRRVQ